MIRKRIPRDDDKAILGLVIELLVPYARKTQPDLRVDMKSVRSRLRPCTTYVAVGGGRAPAGFVSLRTEKNVMYIDMLAVHPNYQGKGMGSRLMERAERTALRQGFSELHLWVDETNGQAQRFYASRSYEPIHYDAGIRCYLLQKSLNRK